MLHENVDFTPYEDMEVQGWPELTMVRGRTVVKEGKFYGERGYGEFVRRTISSDI
jgi:dihydropyrimidinase